MNTPQDRLFFQLSLVFILMIYALLFNQGLGGPTLGFAFFESRPAEVSRYDLQFTAINGEPLPEPVSFLDDDAESWVPRTLRYDGQRLVNQLGNALYDGRTADIEDFHLQLQQTLLTEIDAADYQLVFIAVNPVEKFSMGSNRSEKIMGHYSYNRIEQLAEIK